jgi:exopolysaccharide production protein ExoQ
MTGNPRADDSLDGAWNGVFGHRNQLGVAMTLGCLCCGWLALTDRLRRVRYCFGLAICFLVILKTGSKTTLLVVLLMPIIGMLFKILRRPGVTRLWGLYCMALLTLTVVLILTTQFDPLMALIGRDADLTGRVPLWTSLLALTQDHLLLGYGFGSFWGPNSPQADQVRAIAGWSMFEAHEGYLEMLIALGVPGVVLSVFVLVEILCRALFKGMVLPWAGLAWTYAMTLCIINLSEVGMFTAPGNPHSVLLPLFYAALAGASSQATSAGANNRRRGAAHFRMPEPRPMAVRR